MVDRVHGLGALSPGEFLFHPAAHARTELVRGRVQMMSPVNAVHGLVTMNVGRLLSVHVRQFGLGACFADSTGYALPNLPDTVRAPDASFVRADRLPPEGIGGGFLALAPDLAVEVLSPSESAAALSEKLADYRAAGTRQVWVIDPATRTVVVVDAEAQPFTLANADVLHGGEVVPGFACVVRELFEGLSAP